MGIIKFYSLQCGFESTHWGNRDISRHRQTTLHVVWSTLVYFCISDDFRKDAAMLSKPHGRVLSINVINPFQQNCFPPISPLGETKSDWLFPFSQLTIDHNWPLLRLPQSYFAFRLMVWKKHFQTFEALENPSVLPPTIPCGLEHRLPSIECWVLFCDLVFVSQLFDNVWYMMYI